MSIVDETITEITEQISNTFITEQKSDKKRNKPKIGYRIYTYAELIQVIKDVCSTIAITYSDKGDGRISSAIEQDEYLTVLQNSLYNYDKNITFELEPVKRHWWDFRINNIPFNLKLTKGGQDNAFNKIAIIYTLTEYEPDNKNMNFNTFYEYIKNNPNKNERNRMTEYHYLVVNKNDGNVLIKSILDIYKFKSNPCNILQINWSDEFKNASYVTDNTTFKKKIQDLISTIQNSVKQYIKSMSNFIDANIEIDFPI